jgi:hypothetical protein
MNRSQKHECRNWDCGRAVPLFSNIRYCVFAVLSMAGEGTLLRVEIEHGWSGHTAECGAWLLRAHYCVLSMAGEVTVMRVEHS